MSPTVCHYESELGALHRFHRLRLSSCPEDEVERIRCRLAVLRAAETLPESAFDLLAFVGAGKNPAFRALARRLRKP